MLHICMEEISNLDVLGLHDEAQHETWTMFAIKLLEHMLGRPDKKFERDPPKMNRVILA